MALIKCNECGKEISNKTKECIHCGCPILKQNNTLMIIGIIIILVGILTPSIINLNFFNISIYFGIIARIFIVLVGSVLVIISLRKRKK